MSELIRLIYLLMSYSEIFSDEFGALNKKYM